MQVRSLFTPQIIMKEKDPRGGPRPGSGRPKLEPTTTLSYRVPVKVAEPIDKEVRKIIKKYKKQD